MFEWQTSILRDWLKLCKLNEAKSVARWIKATRHLSISIDILLDWNIETPIFDIYQLASHFAHCSIDFEILTDCHWHVEHFHSEMFKTSKSNRLVYVCFLTMKFNKNKNREKYQELINWSDWWNEMIDCFNERMNNCLINEGEIKIRVERFLSHLVETTTFVEKSEKQLNKSSKTRRDEWWLISSLIRINDWWIEIFDR